MEKDIKTVVEIILMVILVLWLGSIIYIYYLLPDWNTRGSFGDTFGTINSLFSGLALGGIVITLILQSRELSLQREELKLTREEIRGQKEQLEAQNETFKLQAFENTFFQMLNLHNTIVNVIDLRKRETIIKGRDCFREFYEYYKDYFIEEINRNKDLHPLKLIGNAYKTFLSRRQSDTGHYFRNLYNIIKLIDRSNVSNKNQYTNIVRAQLSQYELVLLFYNCLSEVGNEKFKPLVEKYALLKNMDTVDLIDNIHKNFYSPAAYSVF